MKNFLLIPLIFFTIEGSLINLHPMEIEAITASKNSVSIYLSETEYISVEGDIKEVAISWLAGLMDVFYPMFEDTPLRGFFII